MILLDGTDFIHIFTDEQRKQGVPDKYNFPEAIEGNVHYHRVLVKAQAKKILIKLQAIYNLPDEGMFHKKMGEFIKELMEEVK